MKSDIGWYFADWDFGMVGFIGSAFVVVGLLSWFIIAGENADMKAFYQRCLAAKNTVEQCNVLAEVKRSADSAQISSSFAVGLAAGQAGRVR